MLQLTITIKLIVKTFGCTWR